jgi:hypothetical protein
LVKCHIYSVLAERNVCGTINFFDLIWLRNIFCGFKFLLIFSYKRDKSEGLYTFVSQD